MTLAHHSAGDPVPVDWSFRPDPVLEPLTEVMSVHGSSEAADSPAVVLPSTRTPNATRLSSSVTTNA